MSKAEVSVTAYLVARTVAAFGRICDEEVPAHLAACIGYHDQNPVMRIQEAGLAPEGTPARLLYVEGSSKKFWEITVSGADYTVRYGRISTEGKQ